MADPRPLRPRADEPLEALNDSLGRFLRQADELLDDWSRFGADVRTRIAADADHLGATVATAIDASVDRAASQVSDAVASRLLSRLTALTSDLDRVTAAARRAAATATADHRRTSPVLLGALAITVATNLLLALLLWSRPAVHGTAGQVEPSVHGTAGQVLDANVAQVPDAAITPDAGVQTPDAGVVVDAAPASGKPKPAPARRRRK